jgi:hypothetical protein
MKADADAGSGRGRFAVKKAERWRWEETSTEIGEQRKGQVAASDREWGRRRSWLGWWARFTSEILRFGQDDSAFLFGDGA